MENLLKDSPIDLAMEDFKGISKVHDWRNYVPDEIVDSWKNLTDREGKIIHYFCSERAENEAWD
jgi:hypothetical protein